MKTLGSIIWVIKCAFSSSEVENLTKGLSRKENIWFISCLSELGVKWERFPDHNFQMAKTINKC